MAAPDIDLLRLDRYLTASIPGFYNLNDAEKFPGGQSNPTYLLTADSGEYVLRRKPTGKLLKSAHAVEREFRVILALEHSDVPVPKPLHLCEDEDVIGTVFYVMSYVPGRTLWDPSLPELDATARAAIYSQMNQVLAAIHKVDLVNTDLSGFGKPGNYFNRQFIRWVSHYRATATEDVPELEAVIIWLEKNMPTDDGRVSLVHGDFRLDNMVFAPDRPVIAAVLDWELSTLGHPFADLAYQCAMWRMPATAALRGLKGVDRLKLGIPRDEDYIADYCTRMGFPEIDNWSFYLVFSLFRLAAIVQGVKRRALDGTASSDRAAQVGGLVRPLACEAYDLLDS